jgi:hypothetical protein
MFGEGLERIVEKEIGLKTSVCLEYRDKPDTILEYRTRTVSYTF